MRRLITGVNNATSTVWKDRFLCFWFYTPRSGEGYILGYPIDWEEAHLLVRIDRQWDYDRLRVIPPELTDQIEENLARQLRHGGADLGVLQAWIIRLSDESAFHWAKGDRFPVLCKTTGTGGQGQMTGVFWPLGCELRRIGGLSRLYRRREIVDYMAADCLSSGR